MKTIFKYLLLVIISLSIIEGLGALALKIHIGKLPSLKTLYTERQAIAEIKDNYKNESKSDWNLAASNMTVHPYLGFVFNPEHNSTELSNSHAGLKITDYGNIDSESPIRKPAPNEVIVGITGGSVAFWLSAIGTKTLEKELLKSPALKDKKIVFVRLGLGGYKQPQQLMQLNYLLIQGAHLDILINIDGFNEIALPPAEYFGSRVNPLYPRSWPMIAAGLDLGEPTVILANIIQMHRNKKFWATKMQTELLQRSYFANAIWKMTNDITTQKISDAQRTLKSFENKKQPYFITGPSTHYENISEMIGDIIPTWKKSSIQLNKLCKANNIQYFHFLQPNQYYKKSKPIGEIEAKVALREDHPYGKAVKIGYPLLRNTGLDLKAEGIQFADLTQVFINHPEPLYEDDCCHFNQLGNDILATAVGRAVVAGLKAIPRQ